MGRRCTVVTISIYESTYETVSYILLKTTSHCLRGLMLLLCVNEGQKNVILIVGNNGFMTKSITCFYDEKKYVSREKDHL